MEVERLVEVDEEVLLVDVEREVDVLIELLVEEVEVVVAAAPAGIGVKFTYPVEIWAVTSLS